MSINKDDIVIVDTKCTAIGAFQEQFKELSAPSLGSAVIEAAIHQAGVDQRIIEGGLW
jgi:acetyl-CoA acetyltransferase